MTILRWAPAEHPEADPGNRKAFTVTSDDEPLGRVWETAPEGRARWWLAETPDGRRLEGRWANRLRAAEVLADA